jgi:predicted RNA binding protein YcfA (HicA-like mRNA interferase family)
MPKLKKLSGRDVISILNQFGFEVLNQGGSHIKLRRVKDDLKQTLLIPNHKEIDTGTLRAIVR